MLTNACTLTQMACAHFQNNLHIKYTLRLRQYTLFCLISVHFCPSLLLYFQQVVFFNFVHIQITPAPISELPDLCYCDHAVRKGQWQQRRHRIPNIVNSWTVDQEVTWFRSSKNKLTHGQHVSAKVEIYIMHFVKHLVMQKGRQDSRKEKEMGQYICQEPRNVCTSFNGV